MPLAITVTLEALLWRMRLFPWCNPVNGWLSLITPNGRRWSFVPAHQTAKLGDGLSDWFGLDNWCRKSYRVEMYDDWRGEWGGRYINPSRFLDSRQEARTSPNGFPWDGGEVAFLLLHFRSLVLNFLRVYKPSSPWHDILRLLRASGYKLDAESYLASCSVADCDFAVVSTFSLARISFCLKFENPFWCVLKWC